MNPHNLAFLIVDLTRLGHPPAEWLLEKVQEGVIPEEAFRALVGIRPASAQFDRPGEYWRPVPDWPPYDVSNLARVRSYHGVFTRSLSDTPVCCLRRRLLPDSNEYGVVLCLQGRQEPVTTEELARRAFGPLWQPPYPKRPALDPNPPGEVWRRVPDWPAYEVSPTGLVRSYHERGGWLAARPQRLLRPLLDPEVGAWVELCDGYGGRMKITVAELVRLVYPELKPDASGDSSPIPAGLEVGSAPSVRAGAPPSPPAPGVAPRPTRSYLEWNERYSA